MGLAADAGGNVHVAIGRPLATPAQAREILGIDR